MSKLEKTEGFSLIEILIALGVLAIGMLLAAGTFSAALHFTKLSSERTIGAIVADEAFAKIKLANDCNGINFDWFTNLGENFENTLRPNFELDNDEYFYPSSLTNEYKQYCWSAVLRKIELSNSNDRLVQVTVFVCRKVDNYSRYYLMERDKQTPPYKSHDKFDKIRPLARRISTNPDDIASYPRNKLKIENLAENNLINDGSRILIAWDNCQIFRVLEKSSNELLLEREIKKAPINFALGFVWAVPPAINGGSDPCIEVYQRVMRF